MRRKYFIFLHIFISVSKECSLCLADVCPIGVQLMGKQQNNQMEILTAQRA
jgi:hypothetical protein